ncbi:hypothetical protein [Sphingomonas prati]|uniref:Uncharacterized protein n=1 Tax=Sphingomonas prati TaxID=1843237 RepID=A0A7W9BTJ4_9SPHN|nr:hypothetical protein [Sphingomonas prati]MBB5729730.1 hypothetical protein [Sphingomonas prati]GGE89919.1 hypothetical protein GCM10011404_23530 [Sphingomonas prati]
MKLTATNVGDGASASQKDLTRDLYKELAREVGVDADRDEPYSDAPSRLFRGLALAMIVSAVMWFGLIVLVIAVL